MTSQTVMFYVRPARISMFGKLIAVLLAFSLIAQGLDPVEVYREGRKAERSGDVVRAYLLYAQAAAADPNNKTYWARSLALRTRAALKADVRPTVDEAEELTDDDDTDASAPVDATITDKEIADARTLLPPPVLQPAHGTKPVHLKGNAQNLWEQLTKLFGVDVVFDGDFQAGQPARIDLDDVDYREAFTALGAVTGTIAVALSPKLVFVAKDTEQKRHDMEPVVAVVGSIPEPVSVQEATEAARSVQQVMEITKFAVDTTRRLVLIRDRVSRVRPAQALFEQLLFHRAQVEVDVDFMDVDRKSDWSFGLNLPTSVGLASFGAPANLMPGIPSGFQYFYTFGGGASLLGFAIATPALLTRMSKSSAATLMHTHMLSVEGQSATIHVGDKYPIMTGQYIAPSAGSYTPPPQFNFEDLGLLMKITPKVHGMDEVSLDIEAEFKVLGGGSLDGIPVIQTRKFKSMMRLKEGEAAVMAGLISANEARTISGLYGLASVPVLGALVRQTNKSRDHEQTMIVVTPHIVAQPPSGADTKMIWIGSDSRLHIPL